MTVVPIPVDPREPPVNYEAEQAMLGAILADSRAYDLVATFLRAEHFAEPVHARIYIACGREIDAGRRPDALTLKSAFDADDALKDLDCADYLGQLQACAISAGNAKSYGITILRLWQYRRLIAMGEDLIHGGYNRQDLDVESLIEGAERMAAEVRDGNITDGPGVEPLSNASARALVELEDARKARAEGRHIGLLTGLRDLDAALAGNLREGRLVVIGGRPSMGKTALAFGIAETNARAGHPVAFFSHEMTSEELAIRQMAGAAGQDLTKAMEGDLTDIEFQCLIEAAGRTEGVPFFLDESLTATVGAIRSKARRIKRKHGLRLLVIDYLQLLAPEGNRGENRTQDISAMTRGLKRLARDLPCCVLLLSQLSRDVDKRDDKRPRLPDLRDSGTIEQDADTVLFVYREEYYARQQEPQGEAEYNAWLARINKVRGLAEISIGKQRMGSSGQHIAVRFDGPRTRFSDVERY